MGKMKIRALWPLLAASCLSSCGSSDRQGSSSDSTDGNQTAAAPDSDRCIDGRAIKVGDRDVMLQLTGTRLHWDTAGNILTLKERGNAKEVELVASTYIGGPSLPIGDCLRSGGYIRFARPNRTGVTDPNRYLQAFQQVNPVNVVIGNFPDPEVNSIFNIVKDPEATSNTVGAIIRRGDVVHIRGVSRDPWLVAPANPTDGSAVGLINWNQFGSASPWTIDRRGPPTPGPN